MKKIIVLVMAAIMAIMLLAACNDAVVSKTTITHYATGEVETYYNVHGEKMTEEEYQEWRSEGWWR